jgi:hypothetical protein
MVAFYSIVASILFITLAMPGLCISEHQDILLQIHRSLQLRICCQVFPCTNTMLSHNQTPASGDGCGTAIVAAVKANRLIKQESWILVDSLISFIISGK